ncbi:T9SS type B sorting domain-containing protein [Sunxiuqinia sp. A32]|uniref:T9SS type B sorting domain-containing protein n=1 Tax=Sunxiuqinia sp. A32 TaxID=3461496 RepID=UPI004045A2E1
MNPRIKNSILIFLFTLIAIGSKAQITANADTSVVTDYTSGTQDSIYIFCGNEGDTNANLTASFSSGAGANYEWLKYDNTSGTFTAFRNDNNGTTSSTIDNLEDGGYRVNVTSGTSTETYTAWVFNNWYTVTANIAESNCDYLQLDGSFDQASFSYYDLSNGNAIELFKDVKVRWEADGANISVIIAPQLYNPPPRETEYILTAYDRFNCSGSDTITYNSIVTEAKFTASPMEGETPLEVSFINESENADEYEWFFFRDLIDIKKEAEETGTVSDSIMDNAIDESPTYIYNESGTYDVKLVTTKNSEFYTCTDTFYLEGFIVADTSFIEAPNVFTPNGDGSNDQFIVKYWSIKKIKISIFNRWGKKVHFYENNNVPGFEITMEESAWDGNIGGRKASPGVYYYVAEAVGRDDRKRWAHGFVHLFTEK